MSDAAQVAVTPSFQSLSVGMTLPSATRSTSTVQVFRYSAVTWNSHRIHYDQTYARDEGYPGVLVQSHLHGAFVSQYCTDWMGPYGRLLGLNLSVRRFAVAGETLTVNGVITDLAQVSESRGVVHLELTEQRGCDNEVCVPATAKIELPLA